MATLTPTLTLTSTDISTDSLALSVTDSLTVVAPSQSVSRINATATGANNIIIPASTAVSYLYVKHTGTTDGSTGTAQLVDLEFTADNIAFARLGAGEFLFMPFNNAGASDGVQLQVAHASVVQMEYAFFTKG
tara:strand:- start:682 stop:1080 length:399 start_codon:yes stop_codon:yes gene_type:complete